MLKYSPTQRLKPIDALKHPFFIEKCKDFFILFILIAMVGIKIDSYFNKQYLPY